MTTIVYPVMFDNAFAIIVTDQHHDLTHRLFSPLMLKDFNIITWAWYPLILAFAIGWILLLVTRRKPFLPRKPLTFSSTILYICNSSNLLEDFENKSTLSQRQRVQTVRQRGGRHSFGWFTSREEWKVGIEREPVPHPYKFGQITPNIAP
jgi:hypothetical protein